MDLITLGHAGNKKLEAFVRDEKSTDITTGNYKIIKQRYKNNEFLYAKRRVEDQFKCEEPPTQYDRLQEPFEYIGFYNIPTNSFYDCNVKWLDDDEKSAYRIQCKIKDNIRCEIASYLSENSDKYFSNLETPKLDEEEVNMILSNATCSFVESEKRDLKSFIHVGFTNAKYDNHHFDLDEVLEYIETPEKVISRYKKLMLDRCKNILYGRYIAYKLYTDKYEEIENDKGNILHIEKAIKTAIKPTLKGDGQYNGKATVTILKGAMPFTFTTDILAFKVYKYVPKMDYMNKSDYKKYIKTFGHVDYSFDEVQTISRNGKNIYSKENN